MIVFSPINNSRPLAAFTATAAVGVFCHTSFVPTLVQVSLTPLASVDLVPTGLQTPPTDVDAAIDMGGAAVSLALKSGELWIFRHSGGADLSLDPSVYLEKGRLKPRPTKQIVLSATLHRSEARIGWTLAKAQDTPLAIRDLDRDDLAALA